MSKLASFSRSRTSASVRSMIAVGLLTAAALPAYAENYQVGDFDLTVNSTISVGTAYRVENRDRALYSTGNRANDGAPGTGLSNTGDDGNLNYDKGDPFTTVIKGIHEFELKKQDYGFFGRVKWFYDYTLNNDEVFHGHAPTQNRPNLRLDDSGFNPYARFDGIDLLDAYGYLNTNLGDKPASIRLGRQVIGWGESFFIQSPISGLNTVDVSALRRPGAELKEAFTPSEMLYLNVGMTDNTSVEGFYQLKWRKTVPEGCGTYFSTSDFAADGCSKLAFFPNVSDRTNFTGIPAGAPGVPAAFTGRPLVADRDLDRQPKDDGQFGVALRHYAGSIGTEFGAYYLNYHSRLPLASVRKSSTGASFVAGANDLKYVIDYPEDISVLGGSFSTNLGSWAWAGEVSHAMDVPIQINAVELLRAGIFGGPANTPTTGSTFSSRLAAAPNGSIVNGYDKFDVTQVQTSFIRSFDRVLGANNYAFVGEVGAVFVHDLPDTRTQRYGRAPVFGGAADNGSFNAGFVTDFSWGYRLRTIGTYRDAFMGVDLLPSFFFAHDVEGWSPEPGQSFNEGRMTYGLGLGFEFDANTRASVTYTHFANSADFDVLRDRDFLSFTASYSF